MQHVFRYKFETPQYTLKKARFAAFTWSYRAVGAGATATVAFTTVCSSSRRHSHVGFPCRHHHRLRGSRQLRVDRISRNFLQIRLDSSHEHHGHHGQGPDQRCKRHAHLLGIDAQSLCCSDGICILTQRWFVA